MKTWIVLIILSLLWLPTAARAQDNGAVYSVTFTSTWSQATHPHPNGPNSFPTGAHFSPLIGATHNISATFWMSGTLASPGIEQMAETGATTLLRGEITAAGANGLETLSGPGISSSPGTATIAMFRADRAHPLVTLVSMVAPSPDWFVGVHDLSLLNAQGQWQDKIVVTLYPYDAGSDDGADYGSADKEPTPHHLIANISGQAPFSSEPIGTFTFTRLRQMYLPVAVR